MVSQQKKSLVVKLVLVTRPDLLVIAVEVFVQVAYYRRNVAQLASTGFLGEMCLPLPAQHLRSPQKLAAAVLE